MGAGAGEGGKGALQGTEVSLGRGKVLGVGVGAAARTCVLGDGEDGAFDVMGILPQFFKS